jgi:hypothetical protein
MAEVFVADMIRLQALAKQVEGLTPEEVYYVQQYTHYGDILVNARLRGRDTLQGYIDNLYSPVPRRAEAKSFYCLFLLYVAPDALTNPTHFDEGNLKYKGKELIKDRTFMEYYANTVYPQIRTKTLEDFRRYTDFAIDQLNRILMKRPPTTDMITVYRGSSNKYLQELRMECLELGSFHSTTIYKDIAELFGDGEQQVIYKFLVHPNCIYMYIESISINQGEFEVLLAPGNRYVCVPNSAIPNATEAYANCFILPPQDVVQNNAGAAAAGGGGGGAVADPAVHAMVNTLKNTTNTRRGGRRTRKHKTLRRRKSKTRKQRGGASVKSNPMSRWSVDPIFTPLGQLSETDLVMLADMIVKMNRPKRNMKR